jgi:nitric oxide reductase subunit B
MEASANKSTVLLLRFSLLMLASAVLMGVLASFSFAGFTPLLPFRNLRPLHVSSAVFWILTAAAGGLCYYTDSHTPLTRRAGLFRKAFAVLWITTILSIFYCFLTGQFGGREYWEFPPWLSIPMLAAWTCFGISYFISAKRIAGPWPVYQWMWTTGVVFFFLTYTEANLWIFPWFRNNIVRDITVQWKSNGSLVGSWNMIVYGTAMYLMTRISGNRDQAYSKKAFFFYFLGLINLLFNWGHHTYVVPASPYVRDIAYGISMTEWIILLNIIRGWKSTLTEAQLFNNRLTYRFLLASEIWVFLNLGLALLMSIPAINLYTHGTHITVAHAMGTTIGINTMILLASVSYIWRSKPLNKRAVTTFLWLTNASLFAFWMALIAAGIIKGIFTVNHPEVSFPTIMEAMKPLIWLFSIAGLGVCSGILGTVYLLLRPSRKPEMTEERIGTATEIALN